MTAAVVRRLGALLALLALAATGCAAPVTSAGEIGDRPLRVVSSATRAGHRRWGRLCVA